MAVNIALTQRCNQYCPHCYVNGGDNGVDVKPELGLEDWVAIFRELDELNFHHIHIFGGEPFLVSFLPELCEAIVDMKISYNIATNGTQFKPSDVGWLQNTGGSLVVSIFGNEAFHNKFTGNIHSYQQAEETIRSCLARGIEVSIGSCLMQENAGQYPDLIRHFARMGVQNFFGLHFSPIGRGENFIAEALEPPRWHALFQKLKALLPEIRRDVQHEVDIQFELATYPTNNVSALHFTQEVMPCPLPRFPSITIDWVGRVFPCILFLNNPRWELGTLHEKPLEKILKDLTLDWFDARVKKNQCPLCKYFGKCQGGCPAYTLGMLKDFRCSDLKYLPFCPLRVISI